MIRKKILVLTQTPPAFSGHGTAMRLGNIIQALATNNDVTLICISLDRPTHPEVLGDYWRSLCVRSLLFNVADAAEPLRQSQRKPLTRIFSSIPKLQATWPLQHVIERLAEFQGEHFDHVLVSRIRLMPVWRALQTQCGVRADHKVLDLDDIESNSQVLQVKMLGLAHLGRVGYLMEWLECPKLASEEKRAFLEMDRVLLCSEEDKIVLARRFGTKQIDIVPNTIRVPDLLPPPQRTNQFKLLFVGALNYIPNEHAVKWLIESILPAIEQRVGKNVVRLTVVGRAPTDWMRVLAHTGKFDLHGDVPSVEPYYEACDVVLVPIRAGGGTRIKILEAFGYGRLVLSTKIGAEGINGTNEKELLIANTPDEFASAVARLIGDEKLGRQMIANARENLLERYSMSACETAVRAVFS